MTDEPNEPERFQIDWSSPDWSSPLATEAAGLATNLLNFFAYTEDPTADPFDRSNSAFNLAMEQAASWVLTPDSASTPEEQGQPNSLRAKYVIRVLVELARTMSIVGEGYASARELPSLGLISETLSIWRERFPA